MTGKHMGHTSVRANGGGAPLLPEDITVAEVLKSVGYTLPNREFAIRLLIADQANAK